MTATIVPKKSRVKEPSLEQLAKQKAKGANGQSSRVKLGDWYDESLKRQLGEVLDGPPEMLARLTHEDRLAAAELLTQDALDDQQRTCAEMIVARAKPLQPHCPGKWPSEKHERQRRRSRRAAADEPKGESTAPHPRPFGGLPLVRRPVPAPGRPDREGRARRPRAASDQSASDEGDIAARAASMQEGPARADHRQAVCHRERGSIRRARSSAARRGGWQRSSSAGRDRRPRPQCRRRRGPGARRRGQRPADRPEPDRPREA
jgi:hypothetical protein